MKVGDRVFLLQTTLVALVVTVGVLLGAREIRHYFRPKPEVVADKNPIPYKLPPGVEPFHPEVNVSIDINVTDILAAAAGGAFAWRQMRKGKS